MLRTIANKRNTRGLLKWCALGVFTWLPIPCATLTAQTLRGVIVDETRGPVDQAVVMLLDSTSKTVSSVLTNVRGEFRLIGPSPGRYRVKALRLGYVPTTFDELTLAAGDETIHRLVTRAAPFTLDGVRVVGRSTCAVAQTAHDALAVWDQARTALISASIAARDRAFSATAVTFERSSAPTGSRVRERSVALHKSWVTEPWAALPIDRLRLGYVKTEGDSVAFYAPGLDVLASDAFLEDHCVTIAESRDASRVDIAFTPSLARKGVAEIRGTMSLDRITSELRHMQFGYVNIDRERARTAGGDMDFAHLPSGAWTIAGWSIRMPVLVASTKTGAAYGDSITVETRTVGGELVLVTRGADTLWRGRTVAVRGTVRDSLTGREVTGAHVALFGTSLATSTDEHGAFRIDGAYPGNYALNVQTAPMVKLGLSTAFPIDVIEGADPVRVAIPPMESIVNTLCGYASNRTGAILGRIIMTGTKLPGGGVTIRAQWRAPGTRDSVGDSHVLQMQARADSLGRFRMCSLPVGARVTLRASAPGVQTDPVEVAIAAGSFVSVELSATRVPLDAALRGTVVADSTHAPVIDAEVGLTDLGVRQHTGSDGSFQFTSIPSGDHRLLVRRLGYGSLDTSVTFVAGETMDRRIVLSRMTALDSVRVTAARSRPGVGYAAFDERRRMGFGKFVDSQTLRANEHRRLQYILGDLPGVRIFQPQKCRGRGCESPPPNMAIAVSARMGCYSEVLLDGVVVAKGGNMPPHWQGEFDLNAEMVSNIEAVEVYRSAAELPQGYGGASSQCGVILLWSRQP